MKVRRIKGLTLQFLTISEISKLSSNERIKKLLDIIIENKIVIVQGKLKPEEEARLIGDTMILVGKLKGFKGVELAVIGPNLKNMDFVSKFRRTLVNSLVGENDSLTIIGPASIVREIKRNPEKIELMIK